MNELFQNVFQPEPKRRRLRFGLRGLLAAILVLAIPLALISNLQRQATQQESFVAGLEKDGIRVNRRHPTPLCFALMKVLSADSLKVETTLSRWISRGWLYRPEGFNAGILSEERVPAIVKRLSRLGDICEVTFTHPSLRGLKLFYVGASPKDNLGPHGSTCVIRLHPAE